MSDPDQPVDHRLTPTEDLALTLLVSRHRLGERMFLISSAHRRTLRSLAAKGLVRHEGGSSAPGADKVFLTEPGLVLGMDPDLRPPLTRPECPSWYLGPATHESRLACARRNHHRGKHRARSIGDQDVTWTDAESQGRTSETFGAEMRRLDAEHRARLANAIASYRPDARIEDYT